MIRRDLFCYFFVLLPNFPNYQKLVSLGNDSKGFIMLLFFSSFLSTRSYFWFLACSLRTKPRTENFSATVLVRKPHPDRTHLEFRLNIYFDPLCLSLRMDQNLVFRDAEVGWQNPHTTSYSTARPIRTAILGTVARVWRPVALSQIWGRFPYRLRKRGF